jgi:hypothetical protein
VPWGEANINTSPDGLIKRRSVFKSAVGSQSVTASATRIQSKGFIVSGASEKDKRCETTFFAVKAS